MAQRYSVGMRAALRRFEDFLVHPDKSAIRHAIETSILFVAALGGILYAPSGGLARPLALVALGLALVGLGSSIFGKQRHSDH
jgi:hypothetical protein